MGVRFLRVHHPLTWISLLSSALEGDEECVLPFLSHPLHLTVGRSVWTPSPRGSGAPTPPPPGLVPTTGRLTLLPRGCHLPCSESALAVHYATTILVLRPHRALPGAYNPSLPPLPLLPPQHRRPTLGTTGWVCACSTTASTATTAPRLYLMAVFPPPSIATTASTRKYMVVVFPAPSQPVLDIECEPWIAVSRRCPRGLCTVPSEFPWLHWSCPRAGAWRHGVVFPGSVCGSA